MRFARLNLLDLGRHKSLLDCHCLDNRVFSKTELFQLRKFQAVLAHTEFSANLFRQACSGRRMFSRSIDAV